jgi:hypothetical protein
MSETKWTPGPWHVERRKRTVEIHTETTAGLFGASLAAVHSQRLNNNYPSPAKAEHPQMANAHLIAAAPELYAACEKAKIVLEDNGIFGSTLNGLRRALAKARGEAVAR